MKDKKVLWIDDEEKLLNISVPNFKREGINVKGLSKVKLAKTEIQKNLDMYSAVLLDLELKQELNGLDLMYEIREKDGFIPVIILSAKLDVFDWAQKVIKLEDNLGEVITKVSKPLPITADRKFKEFKNNLNQKMERYEKIHDPFKYSFEEYLNLSEREMNEVTNNAFLLTKQKRKEFFSNNPTSDWIIIAKDPDQIIKYGGYNDIPSDELLTKIAKEINSPVFGFTRPKVIEELNKGWTEVSKDDYYPTLSIKVKDAEITGDFDTGCPYSFACYNYLRENNLIKACNFGFFSSDLLLGKSYFFHPVDLEFIPSDKVTDKIYNLKVEAVKNWKKSPLTLHYKDRSALIGRNILINNKIKILLDGTNKNTTFI